MGGDKFVVAMYPWFALGHLTSFIHLSNKLAERGHRISFFVPKNTQLKLNHLNLHPHLITFFPITVPHVDGLPHDCETTADIPFRLQPLLMEALDLTQDNVEISFTNLHPQFVFYDFAHWMPKLARRLGIKSLHYCTISPATVGYLISPERKLAENPMTAASLMKPPPGFPSPAITLRAHEARGIAYVSTMEFGKGLTFVNRQNISFTECDAIAFKTCKEMEGSYCDYLEKQLGKKVFLAGPILPDLPTSTLDERWAAWLESFHEKSVIFCAFGSECILGKTQLQELLLGFELTGLPFFVALRTPIGFETIESALPEGFKERIGGRGIVYGGWVQQQWILRHNSVGCFVTHCGSGSLTEAMVNECQLVLLPNAGDQFINARLMGGDLAVGVEVEKGEEDGLFTKEGVCKAVNAVMDEDSEIGNLIRNNHCKWREFLLSAGLENSYVDGFVENLKSLL